MKAKSLVCGAALAAVGLAGFASVSADASDRLDRFRQLAVTRLAVSQVVDPERAFDAHQEVYALLDEEIVENLAAGSVFASTEFLQLRLDGFAEAWGGATLRVERIGALVVGVFTLSDGPHGGAVHVYGRFREEPALLRAIQRQGRPTVHPLPPTAAGAAQFLVAWEGPSTGRGTRALRLDLLRQHGEDVASIWSTADLFEDGLAARSYHVRGTEVTVRYELRYAGWTPGCDGQTEAEDVYRLTAGPGGGTFVQAARRQFNAWHLTLHRTVERLLTALAAGDGDALTALVPDPGVRQRLPARLALEPACDAADAGTPTAVSVAAVAGERHPWTLTFRRAGTAWRLQAASPVLP